MCSLDLHFGAESTAGNGNVARSFFMDLMPILLLPFAAEFSTILIERVSEDVFARKEILCSK